MSTRVGSGLSTISVKWVHLLDTLNDFFARWGCRDGRGFVVFTDGVKVQVADRDDVHGNIITVSVDTLDRPYTLPLKKPLRNYQEAARWAHARAVILRVRRRILQDIYGEIKIDAHWHTDIGEATNTACGIEQDLGLEG
jgi:hypothetical protein